MDPAWCLARLKNIILSTQSLLDRFRNLPKSWFVNFVCFWPLHESWRISVPRSGIEAGPWQWKHQVITTELPGNSLGDNFWKLIFVLPPDPFYLNIPRKTFFYFSTFFLHLLLLLSLRTFFILLFLFSPYETFEYQIPNKWWNIMQPLRQYSLCDKCLAVCPNAWLKS